MKKIIIFIILNILLINTINASEKISVNFSKCVDGDTIKVIKSKEEITIRLLAVDTPETKHPSKKEEAFGKEASNFTCNKIKNASKIEIEYDKESSKTDKYDRHLTWVYVDGILLQEELVKNSLAKIEYIYGDYKYINKLEKLEEESKLKKEGIWSLEEKEAEKNKEKKETNNLKVILKKIINETINSLLDSIIKEIKQGIKSLIN